MVFNVAVIGYGMSAKIFHIPFITTTQGLKLHGVVQRNPTPESSAQKDHPAIKVYSSVDAALADPDVHVIGVLTPPPTHFPLAKAALEAGKHVLVEKPFVTSVTEANELIQHAAQASRLICVYQNRRWDTDFLTVQKLVRDEVIGRIIEIDTHFDRYRPQPPTSWKGSLTLEEGGTAIFDLGTHLIDQLYVLFGMPSTVYGTFMDQRSGNIGVHTDTSSMSAVLKYPDAGLVANVRISVMSAEAQQRRFWVRGSKGAYHKYGLDPQEDQLKGGMGVADARFGHEPAGTATVSIARDDGSIAEEPFPTTEPATYREFYRLFAAALESGKDEDIPVKASEARDVLRIIEAVIRSAAEGREVTP